ncbi:hypothetical protein PT276_02690 [Orbaceae bacterium ESL0721]|nr:hypothetical protein [Orbaceae bacterium ESL0721]
MLLINKKTILIYIAVICLTACALGNSTIDPATFDRSIHARIRLYGQNQKPTIIYYFQNGHKVEINTGGELADSFLSFIGLAKNQTIGIPNTTMSTNFVNYSGNLSKMFYQEFVIPTGVPITVRNSYSGFRQDYKKDQPNTTTYQEHSCNSKDLTFTPEAGKDYEAVPAFNSAECGVVILRIDGDYSTERVNL